MSETECTQPNRRRWLGVIGAVLGLAGLSACSKWFNRPLTVPCGQELDVSQAGTFVEFDFRIDKTDRYDVLLEVFKKDNKEHLPREVWDIPNAHFKVRLQSLATPEGEVLLEREVSKAEGGMSGISSVGPSVSRNTKLMSFKVDLSERTFLAEGTYHIRVDNLNPIPALQDRTVKISIKRIHYAK